MSIDVDRYQMMMSIDIDNEVAVDVGRCQSWDCLGGGKNCMCCMMGGKANFGIFEIE